MALMAVVAALAWQEVAVQAPTLARCRQPRASVPDMGSCSLFPTLLLI